MSDNEENIVNTDIYNMNEALFNMQKNMMEETDEETLSLGTYGWFNSAISQMIVSNIKVAADNSNEVFATRAKYDKNVIYHAINSEITDINAVPASIPVLFCILEDSLTNLFEEQGEIVTISDECKFMIGEYEYHFDYPVLITKQVLENNNTVYTAKYDITYNNPLSDIDNPFLPSPFILKLNGNRYIFIACELRQVERNVYTKVMQSNNSIENKMYLFDFENQLASFSIFAKEEDGTVIKINSYFENTAIPSNETYYCWYTYIDENTVRVKFEPNSYMPSINTKISTVVLTTQGSKCNFEYTSDCIISMEDTDNYNYNAAQIIISPQGKSEGGKDKRSTADIKAVLPKQALSRGNIINETDIYNYFNRMNSSTIRVTPKKKVDNQIMRCYYLYLLLKDKNNIVVPTNTIDINFDIDKANIVSEFKSRKQYFYKQGTCIGYNRGGRGEICTEEDKDKYEFMYTLPYKISINDMGPIASFYMDVINKVYKTYYTYINNYSPVQFICSSVKFIKGTKDDKYRLNLVLNQNIDSDYGLFNKETNECNIKVAVVLYDSNGAPYRYFLGELTDQKDYSYSYTVNFETDEIINEDNDIKLSNGYIIGSDINDIEEKTYGYFPSNCKTELYVFAKFDNEYGVYNSSNLFKGLDGYTCTNMFTVPDGLNFFENFTEITKSSVDVLTNKIFVIKSVPVLKYEYSKNEENTIYLLNKLIEYKKYIYDAINVLENSFSIDFKFYNTYGPSFLYKINSSMNKSLDKVNVTLNFEMMLKKSADDYTKNYIIRDIQNMFEEFDEDSDNKYIANIISYINNKYQNSIYYLAYRGFNNFDSNYQNFFLDENLYDESIEAVPEFVCLNRINTKDGENMPDVNITLNNLY